MLTQIKIASKGIAPHHQTVLVPTSQLLWVTETDVAINVPREAVSRRPVTAHVQLLLEKVLVPECKMARTLSARVLVSSAFLNTSTEPPS
jgi:hypothetical protein